MSQLNLPPLKTLSAALVAGILHDGLTTVGAIKRSLIDAGVPVRG